MKLLAKMIALVATIAICKYMSILASKRANTI